jgi:hypothetical protein
MKKESIKPGKWLYGLAGGIALLGILLTAFTTIFALKSSSKMERIIIPGSQDIYFEETGKYIIYHEFKSELNGQYYYSKSLQGLDCKVFKTENREEILITPNKTNSTYQFGEKEGRAISNFIIEEPGNYTISARFENNGNQTVLAIGRGNLALIILLVSVCIFVLAFCLIAAKAIAIITFVVRRRNKINSSDKQ